MSKPKVLILCTGNSCRSHMAEGILRNAASELIDVASAGSNPSGYVHPNAITALDEIGIDISSHTSDPISLFRNKSMDIVVTVCDNANKACPFFSGRAERIHWSVKDPIEDWDSSTEDLVNFRKTRDELTERIKNLLKID